MQIPKSETKKFSILCTFKCEVKQPVTYISSQDNVVTTMYTGVGAEQKMAQEVLTTLKEHPDSWTKVM